MADEDGDDGSGRGRGGARRVWVRRGGHRRECRQPGVREPSAETANAVLTTGDTELGTVVVDAKGMTVYVFDKDTPGSGVSTCTDVQPVTRSL